MSSSLLFCVNQEWMEINMSSRCYWFENKNDLVWIIPADSGFDGLYWLLISSADGALTFGLCVLTSSVATERHRHTHTHRIYHPSPPLHLTEFTIISLAKAASLFLMGWNYFTASAERFGKVHPTTQYLKPLNFGCVRARNCVWLPWICLCICMCSSLCVFA